MADLLLAFLPLLYFNGIYLYISLVLNTKNFTAGG
jgi:hypothetical protein